MTTRRSFNRRSATNLVTHPIRGLKPTATFKPSLREARADASRHSTENSEEPLKPAQAIVQGINTISSSNMNENPPVAKRGTSAIVACPSGDAKIASRSARVSA